MERTVWSSCPACRRTEFEVCLGAKHAYSIEQICVSCGEIGPDLHFTAPEREAAAAREAELATFAPEVLVSEVARINQAAALPW